MVLKLNFFERIISSKIFNMISKLLLLALAFYILFCFYTTEELSSHEVIEKITSLHTAEGLLSHEVPTVKNFVSSSHYLSIRKN